MENTTLYTLSDVNIPEEGVGKVIIKPFPLDERSGVSTKASERSVYSGRNYFEEKVKEIQGLLKENYNCLEEKLFYAVKKQEKAFTKERQNTINQIKCFQRHLLIGIDATKAVIVEKAYLEMRNIEIWIKLKRISSNSIMFLLENALFLLKQKSLLLKGKRTEIN